MVKANELIGSNTDDIRVVQFYTTKDSIYETKQLVIRNKDTSLKKKLGGPQIYTVKVRGENGESKIEGNTNIKVYCNCADFTYRRAYCLYQRNGLLIPEGFVLTPPEKTNPDCNKKYCKHVSAAVRYLITTGK